MLLLGFFAAYRAIRSHLPAGDDIKSKKIQRNVKDKSKPPVADETTDRIPSGQKKVGEQILNALRVAGLIFMIAGSSLVFHPGGFDYGPAHFDELTMKVFGGALFVVGLLEFLVLPKLLGKPERK